MYTTVHSNVSWITAWCNSHLAHFTCTPRGGAVKLCLTMTRSEASSFFRPKTEHSILIYLHTLQSHDITTVMYLYDILILLHIIQSWRDAMCFILYYSICCLCNVSKLITFSITRLMLTHLLLSSLYPSWCDMPRQQLPLPLPLSQK